MVADAWHWFDAQATITELRRVLKPGGWLGLVWNVMADPVEPWEFELASEPEKFDRETKRDASDVAKRLSYFPEDELEVHQFAWTWELTPEHRAANLATTSMLIYGPRTAGAAARSGALRTATNLRFGWHDVNADST